MRPAARGYRDAMTSSDGPSVRVGTSGWRYAGWRGDFYPAGLRQRDELAYIAGVLSSVEINGSFYSLQRPSSYRRWRDAVPDDFVFAVKGGRFVSHLKRLRDVETPLANFFASGVLALGPTLGPVLWQLPERLTFDAQVVDTFLGCCRAPRRRRPSWPLVTTTRCRRTARSWWRRTTGPCGTRSSSATRPSSTRAAVSLLRRHGIATVVADTAGRWPQSFEVTGDLVYVRLHGDTELYTSGYGDESLEHWAGRCREWLGRGLDVVVYFDNDAQGHAPHDAQRLLDLLGSETTPAPAA